jgi:bifunctional non-homologous end joining protein LigD
LSFVVQKHRASRLHYDFRLELDGVLLLVGRAQGPELRPATSRSRSRRDHPLAYGSFEGTIPKGQYGAGSVIVWDRGTWEPAGRSAPGPEGAASSSSRCIGHKLFGLWELVRIAKPGDRQEAWILFKKRDRLARPRAQYDVVSAMPDSVIARPLKAEAVGRERRLSRRRGAGAAARQAVPQAGHAGSGRAHLGPVAAGRSSSTATGLMARVEGKAGAADHPRRARLVAKMPALVQALAGMAWAAPGSMARSSCWAARARPTSTPAERHRQFAHGDIEYFLFDLPYFEGYDLRQVPLAARRQVLERLLEDRRSRACASAPASTPMRRPSWSRRARWAGRRDGQAQGRALRVAPHRDLAQDQEQAAPGVRRRRLCDRSSGEAEIGALLLGVHDEQACCARRQGRHRLEREDRDAPEEAAGEDRARPSPFGDPPAKDKRWGTGAAPCTGCSRASSPRWSSRPGPPDQQLRHAKFIALRADKPAAEVQRENAVMPPDRRWCRPAAASWTASRSRNPERVIDPASGVTKIELVRYYASVAEWMLPHLKGRPCSLVRGPKGVDGELFFQKHLNEQAIAECASCPSTCGPGMRPCWRCRRARALVAAAQMNVHRVPHLEPARVRKVGQPDRVIFDLDPGEGVPWAHVQEAACCARDAHRTAPCEAG